MVRVRGIEPLSQAWEARILTVVLHPPANHGDTSTSMRPRSERSMPQVSERSENPARASRAPPQGHARLGRRLRNDGGAGCANGTGRPVAFGWLRERASQTLVVGAACGPTPWARERPQRPRPAERPNSSREAASPSPHRARNPQQIGPQAGPSTHIAAAQTVVPPHRNAPAQSA